MSAPASEWHISRTVETGARACVCCTCNSRSNLCTLLVRTRPQCCRSAGFCPDSVRIASTQLSSRLQELSVHERISYAFSLHSHLCLALIYACCMCKRVKQALVCQFLHAFLFPLHASLYTLPGKGGMACTRTTLLGASVRPAYLFSREA